jgi:molecular chaperone GrpE (heat shock protein)
LYKHHKRKKQKKDKARFTKLVISLLPSSDEAKRSGWMQEQVQNKEQVSAICHDLENYRPQESRPLINC